MRKLEMIIDDLNSGKEVKQLLQNNFKLSSRLITKLKNTNGIKLNGESVTVRKVVAVGDVLELILPDAQSQNVIPIEMPLDILYEDEDILVVNKPFDMPVHPSMNNYDNTLGNAVMFHYKDIPFTYRPVNRLDRDTTGVVIIARSAYSAAELSKQLQNGTYKKTYICVTDGVPNPAIGRIDAPIKREQESVIKRIVSNDGKEAITNYKVLEENGKNALVEVKPITGRTHQIRVHFSYIGCPLKNDFLYGKQENDDIFMLHCKSVEFRHPVTKEKMTVVAPNPSYMKIV